MEFIGAGCNSKTSHVLTICGVDVVLRAATGTYQYALRPQLGAAILRQTGLLLNGPFSLPARKHNIVMTCSLSGRLSLNLTIQSGFATRPLYIFTYPEQV